MRGGATRGLGALIAFLALVAGCGDGGGGGGFFGGGGGTLAAAPASFQMQKIKDVQQLAVTLTDSSGARDVTLGSTGTIYATTGGTVAVSVDGTVAALLQGTAIVTIANGSAATQVTATVEVTVVNLVVGDATAASGGDATISFSIFSPASVSPASCQWDVPLPADVTFIDFTETAGPAIQGLSVAVFDANLVPARTLRVVFAQSGTPKRIRDGVVMFLRVQAGGAAGLKALAPSFELAGDATGAGLPDVGIAGGVTVQ